MRSLLILALLLSACAPRLYPPQVTPPDTYIYNTGFRHDTTLMQEQWWQLFGDSTLNALVDHALANNRDLAAAVIRIESAHDNLRNVTAEYLPQVELTIEAEGDYTVKTKIEQNYSVTPTLSWQVPLFGALRNARRSAIAELLATEWAMYGVRLALTAEVAITYFTLLEYQRDLSIARQTLLLRQESAALIDSMFRYGMSDGVALDQARSLVYTAEADIPQYRRAVAQTWLSMCTLLGENPQPYDSAGSGRKLLIDKLPDELPVGLPSELLTRRPDLMEARYTMLQAAAEAGVARSARFPAIALTGKGGVASSTIKGLTSGEPWVWSAIGTLTQPIFAFGHLRRAEREAIDAYNVSALDYEQAVLTAFSDVESALVAITTCRRQAERTARLVEANRRIAQMTNELYRSGLSDYLAVIDAERELYTTQMQLTGLIAQLYINYVGLCKALGGGITDQAQKSAGH